MSNEKNNDATENTNYQWSSSISKNQIPPLIPISQLSDQKHQKFAEKYMGIDEFLELMECDTDGETLPLVNDSDISPHYPGNYGKKRVPIPLNRQDKNRSVNNRSTVDKTFGDLSRNQSVTYNSYKTLTDANSDKRFHYPSAKNVSISSPSADSGQDQTTITVDINSNDARPKRGEKVTVKYSIQTAGYQGSNGDNDNNNNDNDNNETKVKVKMNASKNYDQRYLKESHRDDTVCLDKFNKITCDDNRHYERSNQTKDIPKYDTENEIVDVEETGERSRGLETNDKTLSKTDAGMEKDGIRYYRSNDNSNSSNQSDDTNWSESNENVTITTVTSQNVKTDIDELDGYDSKTSRKKKHCGGKVGRRRKRGYIYDPKPLISKSNSSTKTDALPTEPKDTEYWVRRHRNNEAAKRSRVNRRAKECEVNNISKDLKLEVVKLRVRIKELEDKNKYLESLISKKME